MEVAVRFFTSLLILASLLLFDRQIAHAESFTIQGENKIWDRSSYPSLDFLIAITNPSERSDWVSTWQLNLSIQAVPGEATGKIFFTDALKPNQNYLFENSTSQIAPAYHDNPDNTEFRISMIGDAAFDFETFTNYSAQVPKTGKNLLDLKLSASEDAQGLFRIISYPSEDITYWQTLDDFVNDPPTTQPFENLPFDLGAPVVIGTIIINNVPEPNSLASLAAVILIGIARCLRKNSRRKYRR
jgi:hypothetical protein